MTNHNPSKSWDIEARARSERPNAFAGVEPGPSPLQEVVDPLLVSAGVRLYVKRDDLRGGAAGNKLRKLKYNLAAARNENASTIVTFGGAYSNHIYATAAAARMYGFRSVGIIRGEDVRVRNPTLRFAESQGMELVFVSRQEYGRRYEQDYLDELRRRYAPCYLLPEGGTNALAVAGCAEMVGEVRQQLCRFDWIVVPCGTGGTLAGIASVLRPGECATGIAALRAGDWLTSQVQALLAGRHVRGSWRVLDDFHCGGYARMNRDLVAHMDRFEAVTGIALEPVYSGKMIFGLYNMIRRGVIAPGSVVVAVHTGGMQGLAGMAPKLAQLRDAGCGPRRRQTAGAANI